MSPETMLDRLRVIEIENAELRERIRALEVALIGEIGVMPIGGMTKTEMIVLKTIEQCPGVATKDRIMHALYALRLATPEIKIVDVLVCKLRRKLAPLGVGIDTVWGQGYTLTAENRRKLAELRGVAA